jgi:hypothetical protein
MSSSSHALTIRTSNTAYVTNFLSFTDNAYISITANSSNAERNIKNVIVIGSSLSNYDGFIGLNTLDIIRFTSNNTVFNTNIIPQSKENIGGNAERWNNIYLNGKVFIKDAILDYNQNEVSFKNMQGSNLNINIDDIKIQHSDADNYTILSTNETGSLSISSYNLDGSLIKHLAIGEGSTSMLPEGSNLYYSAERVGVITYASNMETSNYVANIHTFLIQTSNDISSRLISR